MDVINKMKSDRNAGIDLLKILACFGVVGLHTVGKDCGEFNRFIYFACGYSIPVFFMVHGYLILDRETLDGKYLRRKVIRILEIVFVWNTIISILYLLAGKGLINPIKASVQEMFLQQGFFFQFWYFGGLFLLYLFIPVLKQYLESGNKLPITLLFSVCLIVDIISMMCSFQTGSAVQSYIKQPFRLWTWLFYFYLGGAIKRSQRKIFVKYGQLRVIGIVVVIIWNAAYDYFIGYKIFGIQWAEYFYDNLFMILEVFLMFIIFEHLNISNIWFKTIIHRLSTLTGGVFVIHIIVMKIFYKVIVLDSSMMCFIMWFAVFLSSLFICSLIQKVPIVNKLIKF